MPLPADLQTIPQEGPSGRRRAPRARPVANPQAPSLQRFYLRPSDLNTDIRWSSVTSEARGVIFSLMLAAWELGELPLGLHELARVTPCSADELERTQDQWRTWFVKVPRREAITCPWIESRRREALERYEKHTHAQASAAKSRRENAISTLHREQDVNTPPGERRSILILNEERRCPPDGGQGTVSRGEPETSRSRWVARCQQARGGSIRSWWSFLGRLGKEHGDAMVDRILEEALGLPELPGDPRAWVQSRLQSSTHSRGVETFAEHACWQMPYAAQGCRGCRQKANEEARVDRRPLPYPDLGPR